MGEQGGSSPGATSGSNTSLVIMVRTDFHRNRCGLKVWLGKRQNIISASSFYHAFQAVCLYESAAISSGETGRVNGNVGWMPLILPIRVG